jgi:hypothetical protein
MKQTVLSPVLAGRLLRAGVLTAVFTLIANALVFAAAG